MTSEFEIIQRVGSKQKTNDGVASRLEMGLNLRYILVINERLNHSEVTVTK